MGSSKVGATTSTRDCETRLGVSEIENGKSLGYYKTMLMQIMQEILISEDL